MDKTYPVPAQEALTAPGILVKHSSSLISVSLSIRFANSLFIEDTIDFERNILAHDPTINGYNFEVIE